MQHEGDAGRRHPPASRPEALEALFASGVVGMVRGDGDRLLEANDEVLRILARDRAELTAGIRWRELTPADQLERDVGALRLLQSGRPAAFVKDLLRPGGTRVPVFVAVAPARTQPLEWVAVLVDLSRDEQLARLATAEAAIVATLLEDAPIGFALFSPDLRFVRVNQELAAMNGFTVAEHEDRPIFELLPDLRDSAEPLIRAVMSTGEPLRDVEIVGQTPASTDGERVWLESFFPVRAPHGPLMGVAAIARDVTEVRRLQRELAATMDRQRSALEQLQAGLLPDELPEVAGWDIAARYLSAASEVRLGGDWYDVVRGRDDRLILSVGDAVGHGLPAVGLMARSSAAMRAYAWQGHGPAEVLTLLNDLLRSPDSAGVASAAVIALDVATGELDYACAGHPYPLLWRAGGRSQLLDGGQGPLLGIRDGADFRTGRARLAPGDGLLLFTDGLVERRARSLRAGLAQLRGAVDALPAGLASHELIAAVTAGCLDPVGQEDDVCVLAVTRAAG